MDRAELVSFLKAKSQSKWDSLRQPYLLSDLAVDLLKDRNIRYKDVIDEERLKSFVKTEANESTFKVVEHPSQKAKIGILPSEEDFEFESLPEGQKDKPRESETRESGRNIAIAFIHLLSKLSENEVDSINIPTSIWVKLIAQK